MPNEGGRPEPLAAALQRFLAQGGLAGRLEQAHVLEAWPSVVGPDIARVTRPLSVTADSVLLVAVSTHAWMSELSLLERELLAAVNVHCARAPLRQIQFKLAR